MRSLVWFRADLRCADHTALHAASRVSTRGVVALFTICPDQWREHDWSDVRVDLLRRTLIDTSRSLWKRRIPLLIETVDRFADVPARLLEVMRRHECEALYMNAEYEINERRRDDAATTTVRGAGFAVHTCTDQVVLAPGAVQTGKGDFYSVFTPFRKSWIARVESGGVPAPLPAPKKQDDPGITPDEVPERIAGFEADPPAAAHWPAGEREASKRLDRFIEHAIADYKDRRDRPAVDGTSTLSPYLAIGAISPRRCLHAAWRANGESLSGDGGAATWISELVWREFYRHVLVGFPRVCMHRAFRPETEAVRWREADEDFQAWCAGRTGFPIVDAAMRQLHETGWMHNRLRMIVSMFLTKDLLIDWRRGERHFMRHLVDGDLASNNGGWQWSASTGTDAAPYFRIFNPFSQSRRFDPDGAFIRRYVPELASLDAKAIHDPSALAPPERSTLDYPAPIVDHAKGRARAIKAFERIRTA